MPVKHSYSEYKRGCRCVKCVTASRRYDKHRRYAQSRGIDLLVSSDRARQHVDLLIASGMSRRSIAAAMGYKEGTGLNVVLRRNKIRRTTEQKILSVKPSAERSGLGWVSAVGTIRRMQALAFMGWKLRVVAERAGVNIDTASDLRNAKNSQISERVRDSIARVYDDLSMIDGADVRSKRQAQREGWRSPMAWDNIDNPREKPKK